MLGSLDKNALLVLRALGGQPRNRGHLVESTGWSRNTVAARLNALIEAGWVEEVRRDQGELGRPALRYRVNPRAALAYCASFGWDQLNGAICGLDGEILAADTTPFPLGHFRTPSLRRKSNSRAPPSPGRGRPTRLIGGHRGTKPGGQPGPAAAWSHTGLIPGDFAQHLGIPVVIENDANLMALGLRREFPDARTLVFVKIATGIGAGVVIDGRLHAGMAGLAGEVGHIPVRRGADRQCACGNRGCVGEVAAAPSILRELSTDNRRISTLDDLHALVTQGDGEAVATLRAAGATSAKPSSESSPGSPPTCWSSAAE